MESLEIKQKEVNNTYSTALYKSYFFIYKRINLVYNFDPADIPTASDCITRGNK